MLSNNKMPTECWDEGVKRYNSHSFFSTINHWHVSDYSQDENCDIMIVECKDGRFYIEDNWGGDAKGHPDVFNPFDINSYPTFFTSFTAANKAAAIVVSSITGSNYKELMIEE